MKYRKKSVVIEAITFEDLIEHGRTHGANIVNGMPWAFEYNGHPISHENDDCYLIPTLEGTMKMGRSDMLITGVRGEIYPCKRDIFEQTYESAFLPTGHVASTKQHRKDLDDVLQRLKRDSDRDYTGERPPDHPVRGSRERSLAVTKIQEAIMWLGMDLKALAEPNPYPESYNPASPRIEPTADGLKL